MRKRVLSPGFFDNPDLSELSPHARLLFAGMWCYCDREGRCSDEPRRIRAAVFPYETGLDADALLSELESAGFVVRYTVDERAIIWVPTFLDHQKPHKNETASRLLAYCPEPADGAPLVHQGATNGTARLPVSVSVSVSVPVSETGSAPNSAVETPPPGDLCIVSAEYERLTSTPVSPSVFAKLCSAHPTDRLLEAIRIAAEKGKTTPAYIGGVARSLASEGWKAPPALTSVPNPYYGLCGEEEQA